MAYVVTSPCVGVKDAACVQVCPCDCFYDAGRMLVIDPEECIDCGLCESECPVAAIYLDADVPESEQPYIEINREFFVGKSVDELETVRQRSE